jgi:hypothetical protein
MPPVSQAPRQPRREPIRALAARPWYLHIAPARAGRYLQIIC